MSFEYLPRNQLVKAGQKSRSTKRAALVAERQKHNKLPKRLAFWKLFKESHNAN